MPHHTDTESACPTCGARLGRTTITFDPGQVQHRCNPVRLAAIDAALARDPDAEEPPARPYAVRLAEGFAMMSAVGDR